MSNWEFYTLFILYQENHSYFPLVTKHLISKANNNLAEVFKWSPTGGMSRLIIDYLPVEYLLYLVYDKSYDFTRDKLFYPIKVVNQFLVELSSLNWCEHCKTYDLFKLGQKGCSHKMNRYAIQNYRLWIGEQDHINLYKTVLDYFIQLAIREDRVVKGDRVVKEDKIAKNFSRKYKAMGNKLFLKQLELYINLGNRIQTKYREISWKERKGEPWKGAFNINQALQNYFMIHYYWWEWSDILLIKKQLHTLQRLC